MTNKIFYLYKYTNLANGKAYIGVTAWPKERHRRHKLGDSGAIAFNAAVEKYGYENFVLQELARFDDANAANYHERAAITAFKTMQPLGYNILAGAPLTEYHGPHSGETKSKISASHKGLHPSLESLKKMAASAKGNTSHLGHPHTAESNAKQSADKLGEPLTKKHRANIAKSLIGNKRRLGTTHSVETRAKMSAAHKGKPKSAKARANMAVAQKGRKASDEARANMSAAHKGKPWSAARRAAAKKSKEAGD